MKKIFTALGAVSAMALISSAAYAGPPAGVAVGPPAGIPHGAPANIRMVRQLLLRDTSPLA